MNSGMEADGGNAPVDLSVVLPVFNAGSFLAARLAFLSDFLERHFDSYEIVAVDDVSTDGSGAVLRESTVPRLRLRTLDAHAGKFAALRAGMESASGRCCAFTDADVPYELSILPHMVGLVNDRGFHIVVGDRTLPGARYSSTIGSVRRLATRLFAFSVRILVAGEMFDTQCGIKAFRGDVAKELFRLLREDGFAGDVELLYVALKMNLEIRRVPARLIYQGASSVRPFRDGILMLGRLLAIRRRYQAGDYRSSVLEKLACPEYWRS
jgi:dolichyl-phosphate beta-glucosyltransferase